MAAQTDGDDGVTMDIAVQTDTDGDIVTRDVFNQWSRDLRASIATMVAGMEDRTPGIQARNEQLEAQNKQLAAQLVDRLGTSSVTDTVNQVCNRDVRGTDLIPHAGTRLQRKPSDLVRGDDGTRDT